LTTSRGCDSGGRFPSGFRLQTVGGGVARSFGTSAPVAKPLATQPVRRHVNWVTLRDEAAGTRPEETWKVDSVLALVPCRCGRHPTPARVGAPLAASFRSSIGRWPRNAHPQRNWQAADEGCQARSSRARPNRGVRPRPRTAWQTESAPIRASKNAAVERRHSLAAAMARTRSNEGDRPRRTERVLLHQRAAPEGRPRATLLTSG
jgi:hypothetical protein